MKRKLFLSLLAATTSLFSFADDFTMTLPSGVTYTSGSAHIYCPAPARAQFSANATNLGFFVSSVKFELFLDNTLLYTETLNRGGAASVYFEKDWSLVPGVYKIRITKGSNPASDAGAVSVDEVPNYTGYGASSTWTTLHTNVHGYNQTNGTLRLLGDVNGDDKADIVAFGTVDVKVSLSSGSAFGSQSTWHTGWSNEEGWGASTLKRCLADVNGDGKDDLVGFGSDGTYIALSNGTSFVTSGMWSTGFGANNGWNNSNGLQREAVDINGDGKADLVGFTTGGTYVQLATGTGFGATQQWSTGWGPDNGWGLSGSKRVMADVNGDNKMDIVGFTSTGVYVSKSTGTAFGSSTQWTTAFANNDGWSNADYFRTAGDVDHDGDDDLIVFGYDGVYVAKSNSSTAFNTAERFTSLFSSLYGFSAAYPRLVGDVNGNGNVDIVGFGYSAVTVSISNEYYNCEPWYKSLATDFKTQYANFGEENTELSIEDTNDESLLTDLAFYPNPSTNKVNFTGMNTDSDYEITIIDLRGVTVKSGKVNSMDNSIDIESLESGHYHVIISTDGKQSIKQLIKL